MAARSLLLGNVMSSHRLRKTAVVIGAGIGGLTSAGALSDYFDSVMVIERDTLSDRAEPRKHVPQGRQPHVLLSGGLAALSEIFSGFSTCSLFDAIQPVDHGHDMQLEVPGLGAFPRRVLDIPILAATRPLLELALRQLLSAQSNVDIRSGSFVTGMEVDDESGKISSVRVRGSGGLAYEVAAKLVIDASGTGTPTLDLLGRLGLPLPGETAVQVDLGYASAIYDIAPGATPQFSGMVSIARAPESSRGGYMLRREDGFWFVLLVGRGKDKPPVDERKYLAFARSLDTSIIFEAIKHSKRIGTASRFHCAGSRRLDFKLIRGFPGNLLPLGDALCRLNPVYGHGMTVAAQEALLLKTLKREKTEMFSPELNLSTSFFSRAELIVESPWNLATLTDLAYPDTRGERPQGIIDATNFQHRLFAAAFKDPILHKALFEVLNLLQPGNLLESDEIIQRVRAYAMA
jgi:2-polyprenyl-6-methoxyphenol hydroxylase-like FAD-dependent oxidoreductase